MKYKNYLIIIFLSLQTILYSGLCISKCPEEKIVPQETPLEINPQACLPDAIASETCEFILREPELQVNIQADLPNARSLTFQAAKALLQKERFIKILNSKKIPNDLKNIMATMWVNQNYNKILSRIDLSRYQKTFINPMEELDSPHCFHAEIIAIYPNNENIIIGSSKGSVRKYDKNVNLLNTIDTSRDIKEIAIDPNGGNIVTASYLNTASIYDKNGNLIKDAVQHDVTSVAIDPTNGNILTGSKDHTVKISDKDGNLIKTINLSKSEYNSVCSIAVDPNNRNIVIGFGDNTASISDKDGNLINTINHDYYVCAVAIDPNSGNIITGSGDATLKISDKNGKPIKTIPQRGTVESIAIHPKNGNIVAGPKYDPIKIFDKDGNLVNIIHRTYSTDTSIAISPNNENIVILDYGLAKIIFIAKAIKEFLADNNKSDLKKEEYIFTAKSLCEAVKKLGPLCI